MTEEQGNRVDVEAVMKSEKIGAYKFVLSYEIFSLNKMLRTIEENVGYDVKKFAPLIRNLVDSLTKMPFWSHVNSIVYAKAIAKNNGAHSNHNIHKHRNLQPAGATHFMHKFFIITIIMHKLNIISAWLLVLTNFKLL